MSSSNRFVREIHDADGVEEASNGATAQRPSDWGGDSGDAQFVPLTIPLGLRIGLDPAHVGALADDLEVDAFLDLSRRLTDHDASG